MAAHPAGDRGERRRELRLELRRAAEPMRLKNHNQPAGLANAAAQTRQQGANLGRVMGVVLEYGHTVRRVQHRLPPPHGGVIRQRPRRNLHAHQLGRREGGHGIGGIEFTPGPNDRFRRRQFSAQPQRRTLTCFGDDFPAKIAGPSERETRSRLLPRQPRAERACIRDQHGDPRPPQQGPKRRLEVRQPRIKIGVIPVEIHHHGDLRQKFSDRAITLVDLGHDPFVGTGPRRRGVVRKQPTEHIAGGKIRTEQGRHEHRRRCRLPVRSADRDQLFIPHRLGQQFAPPHQRQVALAGREIGRMRFRDCRGIGHQIAVGRGLTQRDPPAREGRPHLVGQRVILTRDLESEPRQVDGERADAHAAHANTVDAAHVATEQRGGGFGSHRRTPGSFLSAIRRERPMATAFMRWPAGRDLSRPNARRSPRCPAGAGRGNSRGPSVAGCPGICAATSR